MKIAIIGGGIAGNSAAWLLSQAHDIRLFEAGGKLGGHSNTVQIDGHPAIDTGFIVYNEATYPNLIALFDHLGVETVKTDMSFAASISNGHVEYSGDRMFGQWSNVFKPSHYKMILDILRFYKESPALLESADADLSLGEYLEAKRYSKAFIDLHILPMAAAIWSTGSSDVREFPAKSFIRFFVNHGLMQIRNRPQWYTVKGGSRNYVEKLSAGFKDKIKLGTAVRSVKREGDGVMIVDDKGEIHNFDEVVIAAHSDQALAMLEGPSDQEREVLSCFPYAKNVAYLHTDSSLMPKRKSIWSSWNYLSTSADGEVSLSYWMNLLQPFIGQSQDYFVTLNPKTPPQEDKILDVCEYAHPQFTMDALKGWERIKDIQGKNKVWFCGAWCGYGFHEDGISSGLAVAEELGGVKRPWDVKDKSPAGEHCRPA